VGDQAGPAALDSIDEVYLGQLSLVGNPVLDPGREPLAELILPVQPVGL